jgi:phage baseplate assembly protein W
MSEVISKFIGSGITFPIELTVNGRPEIVTGSKLLESSIRAILCTLAGTRFFLGEFGGLIEKLLQEPNDHVAEILAKDTIAKSLSKWEPRISVKEVTIQRPNEWQMNISIKYNITGTKVEDTFTFPYYSQLIY